MLDCLIIGGGPGGISAALTLKANGIRFSLVGLQKVSSKVEKAEKISNYPGLCSVSGKDFSLALQGQLEAEGISFANERVTGVYAMGDYFTTTTESGTDYQSKTVILAVGVQSAGKIEGEEEFVGRGVSYCATCDGALYKGKTIAVLSTSKRFEHEVEFLSKLASKVYFIPLYKNPEVIGENIEKTLKVPQKIAGNKKADKLVFKDGELLVDGIFLLKESVPPMALVFGIEEEGGHVRVERDMSTNLQGLYAVGDCTGRPYQYAKAVGEGNVAAHSVVSFLRERKA